MEKLAKKTILIKKLSEKQSFDITHNKHKEQLLLLNAPENNESLNYLRKIGLSKGIEKLQVVNRDNLAIIHHQEKFKRNSFTGKQIEEFCHENRYKLIRADLFKGEVPIDLGNAIIEFEQEHVTTHDTGSRTVSKSEINIVEKNFWLLIPLQSYFTKKLCKDVTLFYCDTKEYHRVSSNEILIEVKSWKVNSSKIMCVINDFFDCFESELSIFNSLLMFVMLLTTIFSLIFGSAIISVAFMGLILLLVNLFRSDYDEYWNKNKHKYTNK